MPGPAPKSPALRQRRNATTTRAALPAAAVMAKNAVPSLPEGEWHPRVQEWWRTVWRSPMAAEFLKSDEVGGLYLLADLYQARWTCRDDAKALVEVAKEIRLQEVRFGLSPMDRRRLQWEVGKEDASATTGKNAGGKRKTEKTGGSKQKPATDTRNVLSMDAYRKGAA